MSESRGKFVWYELLTSDPKAAETFYQKIVGWEMKDAGMSDTLTRFFPWERR